MNKHFTLKVVLDGNLQQFNLENLLIIFDDFLNEDFHFADLPTKHLYKSKSYKNPFFYKKTINNYLFKNLFKSIDLFKMEKGWNVRSSDFLKYLSILEKGNYNTYNSLIIDFNVNVYRFNVKAILDYILKFIEYHNINVVYSICFIKDKIKVPHYMIEGFVVEGAENKYLNKLEEKLVKLISNKKDRFNEFIPDIFWLNILTDKHLPDEEMKEEIIKIVGKDYFYKLNDNAYVLQVPVDIEEVDGEEFEIYRKALYEVFEKYDKVIKWDD